IPRERRSIEELEGMSWNLKPPEQTSSKESLLIRDLTYALKIIDQLRDEKERLEEQKDEEIKKLKAQLQKRKEEVEV
nr:hypothetical protein [Tanacetum cinerariifolium]